MNEKDLDLVGKLSEEEKAYLNFSLQKTISPNDNKYHKDSLEKYLSPYNEWMTCAYIQEKLIETRYEFGSAHKWNVDEVTEALKKVDPTNMSLLEKKVTKHDQLAVIEEIGRYVSKETKDLLHPGTTSYDILDTARSYLFKEAWNKIIKPEVFKSINDLCDLAEQSYTIIRAGRTHLQKTSPVPFGLTLSVYAAKIAEDVEECDRSFNNLKGKISGIVGTGAGIEAVIGKNMSVEFEKKVLEKLGLKPDYTANQTVSKEGLARAGSNLTILSYTLGKFANDMRILYASGINEVTSRSNKERLKGSSADPGKNNPINWENIAGTPVIVESGMNILYSMIITDLERDLRSSKTARYEPHQMMNEVLESFSRLNKTCLPNLSVNEGFMAANLEEIASNPSEAMDSILKGINFKSKYGTAHDFVGEMMKQTQKTGNKLLQVAMEVPEFAQAYESLTEIQKAVLNGNLTHYLGSSEERMKINIKNARRITTASL